ncbi:MAG: DUF2147 domain-containing protein [Novosphingobium sp.]
MSTRKLVSGSVLALAGAFGVSAAALPAAAGVSQFQTRTLWANPSDTVKVATGDCGRNLCGWVVWASPDAEKDARDSGVAKLVGTEVLQDYHSVAPARWEGRVFVPDMGRTFVSTITQINPTALKISGCIWGGLICKSQIWHKV